MRLLTILAGLAVGIALRRRSRPRSETPTGQKVRVAGPSEMRDPPTDWTEIDERSDESFPASDPPGTY